MTNAAITVRKQRDGRGKKPKTTAMQDRAIFLIKQNLFSSDPRPLPVLLLEAGYSQESVRQWTNIWLGIKPHVDPVVQQMEEHRNEVLERMRTKDVFERATYGELARSADIMTRNIRLLTGKSTHNFELHAEHRHRLDALIDHS